MTATATLTLWAFLGLECATIPAGSIRDPERTIPRATVTGTLLAGILYIVSTVGVLGLLAPATLGRTSAPFAEAARALAGDRAAAAVALGAAISCFGALNGWILIVGQLPMAVAQDGLFPRVFGRLSARGTPVVGMLVAGVLSTGLVAMNYSQNLVDLFTFIILLATLSTLVPYAFCSLAGFMLRRGHPIDTRRVRHRGARVCVRALGHRRRGRRSRLLGLPAADGGIAGVCVGGPQRPRHEWTRHRSIVTTTAQSEAGTITRLVLKHARDAFVSPEAIAAEWQRAGLHRGAGFRARDRRVRAVRRRCSARAARTCTCSRGPAASAWIRSTSATRPWSAIAG